MALNDRLINEWTEQVKCPWPNLMLCSFIYLEMVKKTSENFRGMLDLKLVGELLINLYSKGNTKNFMFAVIQLHEFASKGKGNGSIK